MGSSSRVIVIVGASSGIGMATALRFAGRSARLVLAARDAAALDAVASRCRERGAETLVVPTDIADEGQVRRLADAAVERFGRIDVWINNAGISVFGPFLEIPPEDFRRVIEVDLMGHVHGSRAALAAMTEQRRGVLINVSSVVGEIPQPFTAPYGMAKSAVRALGVSLRSELRLQGMGRVHVATVLPATIDTQFFQHAGNRSGRRIMAMPPVYPADQVAAAIVRIARSPRPEVIVGRAARILARSHRRRPRLIEAQMAVQTEATHLGKPGSASDTTGNLYRSANAGTASVDGGWHGTARLRLRRLATLVGVAALGCVALRRTRMSGGRR